MGPDCRSRLGLHVNKMNFGFRSISPLPASSAFGVLLPSRHISKGKAANSGCEQPQQITTGFTTGIDVGGCSGTSTKSAAAGGEWRPACATAWHRGLGGRRTPIAAVARAFEARDGIRLPFPQAECGGAGDVADDGKRQAIEHKQKEQSANAAVGHSAGDRLHIGAELGKAEGALRIESRKQTASAIAPTNVAIPPRLR